MTSSKTYRCQRQNRIIKLTQQIALSGEGEVWRTDFSGYLGKIYHDPHNQRIQKLASMVAHVPEDPNSHLGHISFAWPYSILKDNSGAAVGFLMPEVKNSQELLKLCTPQLRKRYKLEANWYFLHVLARNIAGIIQAIHSKGYVLGDIKLQNILVNNQALPTIIDTDSFQVPDFSSRKTYRCLVGSEGFTPPELIGVDIASVDQSEVHDRFRLGVVVYYLLFGGPPFRGKWTGQGESPEQADLIRQGLWPYGTSSLIQPSQTTIPLEILNPELKQCFLSCFNDGHKNPSARPSAQKWMETLEVAFNDLKSCNQVKSHYFSSSYRKCYWCERATNLKIDVFQPNPVAPTLANSISTSATTSSVKPSPSFKVSTSTKVSSQPPQKQQTISRLILGLLTLVGASVIVTGWQVASNIEDSALPDSATQKLPAPKITPSASSSPTVTKKTESTTVKPLPKPPQDEVTQPQVEESYVPEEGEVTHSDSARDPFSVPQADEPQEAYREEELPPQEYVPEPVYQPPLPQEAPISTSELEDTIQTYSSSSAPEPNLEPSVNQAVSNPTSDLENTIRSYEP